MNDMAKLHHVIQLFKIGVIEEKVFLAYYVRKRKKEKKNLVIEVEG